MSFEIALQHRIGRLDLDVTLSGGPGVTALFGPSGCGKTTVVRCLAGLLNPDAGRIAVDGTLLFDSGARRAVPAHRRRMGTVFQDGRLFPHLTVLQNLRFPARFQGRPATSEADLIDLLGLGALLARRPATLSGGETQRVALARALLSNPRMLLLDEPLAALDGPRKDDILPYLDRLKTETGVPILYVTHAVEEMARLADHVALMQEGRITRAGPVQEVLSDPVAMPFLGVREAGAVLMARVDAHEPDGLTRLVTSGGPLLLPGVTAEPGETLRVRIRAQDVILSLHEPTGLSARNILPCTIRSLDPGRGPGVAVVLDYGDQRLLARITERSRLELALEPGARIYAILKATSVSRSAIGV